MSSIRAASIVVTLTLILFAHAAFSRESSNFLLPAHVDAPDGQVTLYADYGGVQTDGYVPVYLVNKSADALTIEAQDGDIYLKLQYQDEDGNWIRAQPHRYSWCGNSYYEVELQPGFFVLLRGYQPINGVAQTVRYRAYAQSVEIVSNSGMGVVAEADIQNASTDAMSIQDMGFERVREIALSTEPVENNMDHIRDLRGIAIRALGSDRFDPKASRAVLLGIRDGGSDMARYAVSALEQLDRRVEAEAQQE